MTAARLSLVSLVRVLAFGGGLAACGHGGKMVVDTPIAPYKAPDIGDITGIDDDDDDSGSSHPAAGSGSATPGK